jgi:membrane peptidoglycan carboxypeptidase
MRNVGGIRVTGGSYPARIWQAYMGPALADQPIVAFPDAPATGAADYLRLPGDDRPPPERSGGVEVVAGPSRESSQSEQPAEREAPSVPVATVPEVPEVPITRPRPSDPGGGGGEPPRVPPSDGGSPGGGSPGNGPPGWPAGFPSYPGA